ncbi:MAG: HAD family phosphatase, partial [Spirochaetia bacterium]|nr:HAD family phosphatase [Spirochaetia bacterium]
WNRCFSRWIGVPLSLDAYRRLNGRTSKETIEQVYLGANKSCPDVASIELMIQEKEEAYWEALESCSSLSLAPGLASLLNYLREHNIRLAIATSATKQAIKRYDQHVHLTEYFDPNLIITNDGNFKSKPSPQIYEHAVMMTGSPACRCMVFEDTQSGIESASAAKCGCIVAVTGDACDPQTIRALPTVSLAITDYNQLDRTLFSI